MISLPTDNSLGGVRLGCKYCDLDVFGIKGGIVLYCVGPIIGIFDFVQ